MGTKILKFYVSNTDVVKHNSVYESIAYAAKRYGLAGTTVYKGIMGFGSSSKLRSSRWEFNEKVPVIVEIIDEEEKLQGFIDKLKPWLDMLPKGCLVTLQDTDIVFKKTGGKVK